YRGLMPLMSFSEAIVMAKPDLIVPGDDLAVQYLYELYYREKRNGSAGAKTCVLIERSIGVADSFPVVYSRSQFMHLAEEEGIRAQKAQVMENIEDLRDWGVRMGFPTVLKANGFSGGEGVRFVGPAEAAERAFRRLQAPPILARVAKRVLLDR